MVNKMYMTDKELRALPDDRLTEYRKANRHRWYELRHMIDEQRTGRKGTWMYAIEMTALNQDSHTITKELERREWAVGPGTWIWLSLVLFLIVKAVLT